MSTETTDVLATALTEVPPEAAPEQQAAPPADGTAPGTDEKQKQAERTFTQKELDELLQKRLAKAERQHLKREREILERLTPQQQRQPEPTDDRPRRDRYQSDDDWIDAMTDWKLAKRDREQATARQAMEMQETSRKTEKLYQAAEKLPGFDREAFDELPLTQAIAFAITESDVAPALMAYMASNPDDVERIARLSPARQAAEIGRLEARIAARQAEKKPPEPLKTVNASTSVSLGKLTEARSQEEFERMRKRQIAARR